MVRARKFKKWIVVGLSVIVTVGVTLFIFRSQIFADTSSPFKIFQKENFSDVLESYMPSRSEIINPGSSISTFAAKGQTQTISFSIKPEQFLGETNVTISDLKANGQTIAKENIEILNLVAWNQCAWTEGCQQADHRKLTSELLLKDSTQDPVAVEMQSNPNTWSQYKLPKFNSQFKTNIKKGQTHTFYLRIKIPDNAVDGNYSGKITISPKSADAQNIGLNLQVYPFNLNTLPEKEKNIGTFATLRVADSTIYQHGYQSIGWENYKRYLKFLRDSGLNTLIIADYNNIVEIAKEAKNLGFKQIIWRAVPYPEHQDWEQSNWDNDQTLNDIVAKAKGIRDAGFDPIIYGVDEIQSHDRLVAYYNFAGKIRQKAAGQNLSVKFAAALPKEFADLINSDNYNLPKVPFTKDEVKLDIPMYNAAYLRTNSSSRPSDYYKEKFQNVLNVYHNSTVGIPASFEDYVYGLWKNSATKNSGQEYYYNQIWFDHLLDYANATTSPSDLRGGGGEFSRPLAGFYLFASKIDGYVPFGIDSLYTSSGLPYNDFDTKDKDYFSLYPAADQNGNYQPVLTRQFEAYRAGIDDSKYLTLYNERLNQVRAKNAQAANSVDTKVKTCLDKFPYDIQSGKSFADLSPDQHKNMKDSEIQNCRKIVADAIVELQGYLNDNQSQTTAILTFNLRPGVNMIGAFYPVPSTQLTNGTNVTVQSYDAKNQKWLTSPGVNLNLEPGRGYFANNPSNQAKQQSVTSSSIGTAATSRVKVYPGWNLLYNNLQRDASLANITVDIYQGDTCLAKNVSIDQLKDKGYALKRTPQITNPTAAATPNTASLPDSDVVTIIPARTGYWLQIKNTITGIVTDTSFANNRCN